MPRSGSVYLRITDSSTVPRGSYVRSVMNSPLGLMALLKLVEHVTVALLPTPLGAMVSTTLFFASYLTRLTSGLPPAIGGGVITRVRLPRLPATAAPL